MSLHEYRRKRKFKKTPEPRGHKERHRGALHFIIHKHAASHLHYDLRLESNGVLKSWAVPKGLSLDPQDRRLAIEVEDHPYDYGSFEGIIPAGNYGAGTVMLWDEGEFFVDPHLSREENEQKLNEALEKGHAHIFFNGHKIKGEFSLIRIRRSKPTDKPQWLIIKKPDEFANQPIEDDTSAQSGRTMLQIKGKVPAATKNKSSVKKKLNPSLLKKLDFTGAKKAPMPHLISPMLATLTDTPFDQQDWIFEVKWDGFRSFAYIKNGQVQLWSRIKREQNAKFPVIAKALHGYPFDAIFDGEIVAVDEKGLSHFQLLQNYVSEHEGTLLYYLFDILYFNGYDLRGLPLSRRKKILHAVAPTPGIVRLSDYIEQKGVPFYQAAKTNHLEGIIAKKIESTYQSCRSRDWLKIKIVQMQEAVIGGFTEPRDSRKYFGALVLGVYDKGKLRYIGHTGGGFSHDMLKDIYVKLKPLIINECPFDKKPKTNEKATWVKPQLTCEIKFHEWTQDGHMRQPIFLGLRDDKPPQEVQQEKPAATEKLVEPTEKKKPVRNDKKIAQPSVEDMPPTKAALTNLDKILWPDEGYTKGDMVHYYMDIADFILPYLKNRPQSLNRHPNGIKAENFFQKNVDHSVPEWIKTVPVESESKDETIYHILCQNRDTLAYIANLGCIEINVWPSVAVHLDKPDYMVFDLDPVETPFANVVEVALKVREVLENLGMPGFCKTSGGRGLHVYVPLSHHYNYDQTKDFSHLLCEIVHRQMPEITSLERSPGKRKGQVYLDYLQNHYSATMVAPYSLRPKPKAPVSTPLEWKEVTKKLDPLQFTMTNMRQRLDVKGDLWKGVLGPGIDIGKTLKLIEKIYKLK